MTSMFSLPGTGRAPPHRKLCALLLSAKGEAREHLCLLYFKCLWAQNNPYATGPRDIFGWPVLAPSLPWLYPLLDTRLPASLTTHHSYLTRDVSSSTRPFLNPRPALPTLGYFPLSPSPGNSVPQTNLLNGTLFQIPQFVLNVFIDLLVYWLWPPLRPAWGRGPLLVLQPASPGAVPAPQTLVKQMSTCKCH